MKPISLCLTASLVIALSGCGSEYKLVPVSGTITLNGEPLPDAIILTQPVGSPENVTPGPGSFARTDANGRFTLELQSEDRVGAVPGECTIKIKEAGEDKPSSDDTVSPRVLRSPIPPDYLEGLVTYTIPEEGTDSMNFDLTTGRR